MSRSRRVFTPIGRLAAAAAVACLAAGVAGCEAGNNAATLTQYHPQSDGTDAVVHGIDIRDAFVLGDQIGLSIPAGQSAGFFLALINEGRPDRLVSVTAPGTAESVRIPPGGIALRNQQPVYLTGPEPKIVLTNLTRALPGGQSIRVILDFQNAGSATLTVPVIPRAYDYWTFSPAPTPAPPPSAASAQPGQGKSSRAGATPGTTAAAASAAPSTSAP